MKQLVIMPGGFHPFHAGHAALYQSAVEAFPGADVYVAATNDTSTRPFPFPVKEKLAQLAGVPKGKFVQVKSPFRAEEITAPYDPSTTQLIFVRSEKDAGSQPRPGGNKKDGSPAYLQPYDDASDLPMSQQAYMAYLPTVEFGPGMTSATEIRSAWPRLNEKRKQALVMSLYPKTQTNPKLAATVVKLLDTAMGAELNEFASAGIDDGNDSDDEKTYLLQLAEDLSEAMYGPNKNKQAIENIMAKIRAVGGDVKITWNPDGTFNVAMYHPVHFKQGYLIRLVGRGNQGLDENTAPNPRVNLTPNFPNYATLIGEFVGIKKNRALFRIIAAELRPGQGETEKIFRAMSTNTPIGIEIGKVKNRAVVENVGKEFILYINGKPAAKYVDQQQAILDMAAVRKKYPTARLELKHEVCDMQTVKQINEGGSILEALKPDAFAVLQQAKQNIEQNRQQEVDQWAQDFRANSAKLAGRQLKQRLAAPPPAPIPVAQPGEGYYALKDRLAQLDIAKQKFEKFNKLIASIKKKYPLVADTLDQLENSLLQDVKDGAADNYVSLLTKLHKYETALTTRFPGIVKEDPDYIEEGRKI
jgi:hypothetical protein